MKPGRALPSIAFLALLSAPPAGYAHDPVFGAGPHVLYKGGIEVAPEARVVKQGRDRDIELALELTYGLTGDWAVGVDLPYVFRETGDSNRQGAGDIALFSKYRFWRNDTLGAQESAAILGKLVTDTADDNGDPATGGSGADSILGLSWGYESRKWYRWASVRWRHNRENDSGLQRGDRVLADIVAGIRLRQTAYLAPDTVWLLELNGERGQRAKLRGVTLKDSGGTEWFVSPGIFWTLRNFAVKAGVQVPVYHDLNGRQARSDYRARLILEWHL